MKINTQRPKIKCLGIFYDGKIMSVEHIRFRLRLSWKHDFISCDKYPDIIFLFTSSVKFYENYAKVLFLRRKYGFSSFIVGISGEPPTHHLTEFDFSISYMPNSVNNYYFPSISYDDIVDKISKIRKLRPKEKNAFCNFIYSKESNRYPATIERIKFCKMLFEYKRVDCAGKVLNNTDKLRKMETNNDNKKIVDITSNSMSNYKFSISFPSEIRNATINFMSNYKFSISFENSIIPGYFTEKIINAFMARTIPIYYGSEDITDYFNPSAFINCHDYSGFSDVIERVKEIDQNPKLFSEYINANPIHKNSRLHQYKDVHTKTDRIIHKAIQKQDKYAQLHYPLVHEIVSWLKIIGYHLPWIVYLNYRRYRNKIIKYYKSWVKRWIYPIKRSEP